MTAAVRIEVQHTGRLCYAMQQSAVPWLRRIAVHNDGAAAMGAVTVHLRTEPAVVLPTEARIAAIPAGGCVELANVDPRLDLQHIANAIERQRAELIVDVRCGEAVLAEAASPLDVLAWNEWPGVAALPELLAAFVSPNHPVLAPVLREVAALLQQATGRGSLDGYLGGDPARARAICAAVYAAVTAAAITYVTPPPSFERIGQKVRTPEQVLGERLGTCLDLALLQAALLEHAGLQPLLVLQRDHAFVGAWLVDASAPDALALDAVELRKRVDLGAVAVAECTMACADTAAPFAAAAAAARRRLDVDDAFVGVIDVAAARRAGILPLPPRTATYAIVAPRATGAASDVVVPAPVAAASESLAPAPAAAAAPRDRLEHWKTRLLDLSLWNRLLNFVETKKTIPLDDHDLAAMVQRLQGGARVRVHARAAVGLDGVDPRDLELAQQRTGVDVRAAFLGEELRAGRLRSTLAGDDLDVRLVEVFRHARTSIEETGANTLYLAVGFLHWYESTSATKARRAPLLLLPLQIERLSVQEGFRLVLDDAEPRVNQSLVQMLARDHGVQVPLGDALPENEDGVDVGAVLDAFRVAALPMHRWEVRAAACIGFFSFSKHLMWLDLGARDELLQSPVLRHLVERPGAAFAQDTAEMPRDEIDDLEPADLFCPKDADSSQLAAVVAGAAGRSFVLEGPPGTGKSQTITNLIAQALAHGKRVLFVAEKRAALEVVQRRLDEAGLGPFCLELHSSKSGPKAVLAQLRRALDIGARRAPEEWAKTGAALQRERAQLNAFVRALHRPREHGGSVFAAMTGLVQLGDGGRVSLPDLPLADPQRVAAAMAAVEALAGVAAVLGIPCDEPWWGVRRVDWTPALAREVPALARRLADAAQALRRAAAPVAAAFGLGGAFGSDGPSADQLAALVELARLFAAASLPPPALLEGDWRTQRAALAAIAAIGVRRRDAWDGLSPRWRPELLRLDLERLVQVHRQAQGSFVVARWWRLRLPRRELAAVAVDRRAVAAPTILRDLETALAVSEDDRRLDAGAATAAVLGPAWQHAATDWARVVAWIEWVDAVHALTVRLAPGALQPPAGLVAALAGRIAAIGAGDASTLRDLGVLRDAHAEFAAALRAVVATLRFDVAAAFGADDRPGRAATVETRAGAWLAAVPRLRDHCAYEREAQAAVAAGLGPLVAAHARGAVPTGALRTTFRRTFLESWLDLVHRDEPALARFRGRDHETAIARFQDLDRRSIALAAEVVLARLAANVPTVRDTQVASSELGVLERELKKQRRHKPVRRLLAEIPGLFARLAPCVLMSPLSVAQFLGRAGTRFDLVVFDEASQIPVWDAVGAIGRGSSLVVVGDSRQLPPTTFFQRLAQGDEPEPDALPEDLESVLDECAAAGLPRAYLDWHYRSRHESLIAFSNHHYYDNRLLTFPAPHGGGDGLGVRFVHVDGVYDRAGSQQNRREALALVEEVKARLLDPARARHSLGIVTFSQAQQVLIEDLLDRARAENPAMEPFFSGGGETVFVKNLENVQGDERDTILFSICYGPDAAGRIHENYGPLNQQGGERRLNVAITRARRELVVFASVRADQVANRSPALGARHLRTFLDYAQRGTAAITAAVAADPSGAVESPFEAAVAAALRARGHEVHTQIGCSGYRIDLAVVDPAAPGRYRLGIECDGAAYHSAATARDRDRLRASVLQGLGWKLHRVWSTDFWQDPAGEIERVEAALAAARATSIAAPVVTVPVPAAPPAEPPPGSPGERPDEPATIAPVAPPAADAADPDGPRRFAAAAFSGSGAAEAFHLARSLTEQREQVAAVLAVEAPVVFDRLARTVAAAWGVQRVTDRVRERVRASLPAAAVEIDGALWPNRDAASAFRGFRVPTDGAPEPRPADELPGIEIENAMVWLLRQHQALAIDDLAREAARCFGISRLGAVVRQATNTAIDRLVASGRSVRDGAIVRRA